MKRLEVSFFNNGNVAKVVIMVQTGRNRNFAFSSSFKEQIGNEFWLIQSFSGPEFRPEEHKLFVRGDNYSDDFRVLYVNKEDMETIKKLVDAYNKWGKFH